MHRPPRSGAHRRRCRMRAGARGGRRTLHRSHRNRLSAARSAGRAALGVGGERGDLDGAGCDPSTASGSRPLAVGATVPASPSSPQDCSRPPCAEPSRAWPAIRGDDPAPAVPALGDPSGAVCTVLPGHAVLRRLIVGGVRLGQPSWRTGGASTAVGGQVVSAGWPPMGDADFTRSTADGLVPRRTGCQARSAYRRRPRGASATGRSSSVSRTRRHGEQSRLGAWIGDAAACGSGDGGEVHGHRR